MTENTADDRFADLDGLSIEDLMTEDIINEAVTGPVVDFATDFDHTDPRWAANPYPIWEDLRERCPVARTERYGGAWLPTRHDDVAAIAYDTDRFSSRSVLMSNMRPPVDLAPVGIAPPISSDPPFHHGARRLLLAAFAPQAIAKVEEGARAYCHELIDAMDGREVVDAAEEYAQHIPVRVIADMLGFPQSDGDLFTGFVHDLLEGVDADAPDRAAGIMRLFEYLHAQVMDHAANPRDDLKFSGEAVDYALHQR